MVGKSSNNHLLKISLSISVSLLALWLAHFCHVQTKVAIAPLYNLLRRFVGESTSYLTALHPIFLHASLRANQYDLAEYLLVNTPVTDVDPKVSVL